MEINWATSLFAYMHLWLPLLVAWELVWKGIALWRAARNAHLAWFICLFIFSTVGILPIIYIFAFSEKKR